MAFSRSQEFRTNEQHTALICQALSHPARIRMISRLVNAQESSMDYASITADIPLNPSTISQHLKYLRSRNINRNISIVLRNPHDIIIWR